MIGKALPTIEKLNTPNSAPTLIAIRGEAMRPKMNMANPWEASIVSAPSSSSFQYPPGAGKDKAPYI